MKIRIIRWIAMNVFQIPPCRDPVCKMMYYGDKPGINLTFYSRKWATEEDINKFRREQLEKFAGENGIEGTLVMFNQTITEV